MLSLGQLLSNLDEPCRRMGVGPAGRERLLRGFAQTREISQDSGVAPNAEQSADKPRIMVMIHVLRIGLTTAEGTKACLTAVQFLSMLVSHAAALESWKPQLRRRLFDVVKDFQQTGVFLIAHRLVRILPEGLVGVPNPSARYSSGHTRERIRLLRTSWSLRLSYQRTTVLKVRSGNLALTSRVAPARPSFSRGRL